MKINFAKSDNKDSFVFFLDTNYHELWKELYFLGFFISLFCQRLTHSLQEFRKIYFIEHLNSSQKLVSHK